MSDSEYDQAFEDIVLHIMAVGASKEISEHPGIPDEVIPGIKDEIFWRISQNELGAESYNEALAILRDRVANGYIDKDSYT